MEAYVEVLRAVVYFCLGGAFTLVVAVADRKRRCLGCGERARSRIRGRCEPCFEKWADLDVALGVARNAEKDAREQWAAAERRAEHLQGELDEAHGESKKLRRRLDEARLPEWPDDRPLCPRCGQVYLGILNDMEVWYRRTDGEVRYTSDVASPVHAGCKVCGYAARYRSRATG